MAKRFLPASWTVGSISLDDVSPNEVDLVASLHQSRSEIGEVDPSFVPVSEAEYAEFVQASVAGVNEGFPFRLQIMRLDGNPCGYFHAYGHHPTHGSFFISMFIVSPEFARRGIGSEVGRGIAVKVKELGFKRILLSVFLANRNALSFWIKQGFTRIEVYRTSNETGKPDRFVLAQDF